jgi:hypothetical protein
MSAHTPGPWFARSTTFNDGGDFEIRSENGFFIAGTIGGMRQEGANARLIAAAPELLAALDMMERHFSRYDDTHNNLVLEQARTAITNATKGAA